MPGDVSITNPTVPRDLTKGDKCFFKRHTDPTDLTAVETLKDEPRCGYNGDSYAYCNVRKGDSQFTSYLKILKNTYNSGIKCHTVDENDRYTIPKCA